MQGADDGDARPEVREVPQRLVGLALSGGGIRSASFALGALQALEIRNTFEQFDYLSAVSGGAYIAGWMQAHLGAQRFYDRDVYDLEIGAPEFANLVANHGDHVEHLRIHSGFLNQGGWLEAPSLFWDYIKRWPAHVLLDDVLHLRGKFNFQHIIEVYEKRIRKTYLRGDAAKASGARPIADTPLADVNQPTRQDLTPYLILNANLANAGTSRVGVDRCARDAVGPECGDGNVFGPKPSQWNFEFTRDFIGSDGTGYVDTRAFGRDVRAVVPGAKGRPAAVVVDTGTLDSDTLRLSKAVAASGAAFDSAAVLYQFDFPGLTEAGQFVAGALLNLYLGLEVPNFARKYDGWWSLWDYARMTTIERVPRWLGTGARWLYVSDGGHYENLGVLALLRRGASCIVALDATADPSRAHDDLKTLRTRIEDDLGLHIVGKLPSDGDPGVAFRLVVADAEGAPRAVILYLKASVEPTQPHLLPLPGFSRFRALREIEAVKTHHRAAVQELFHQIERVAGEVNLAVERPLSRANEEPIERALDQYYDQAVRQIDGADETVTNLQTELDRVRQSAIDEEQRLVSLERERTSLEQQRAKILEAKTQLEQPAAPEGSNVAADTVAKQFGSPAEIDQNLATLEEQLGEVNQQAETTQGTIAGYWAEVQKLEGEIAAARGASVRPVSEVRPASEQVINEARRFGTDHPEFGARIEPALAQFEASRELRVERFARALRQYRDGDKQDEDRRDRIRKVLSFVNGPSRGGFPNDSTLQQWYTWERFDAYRALGYQTVSTFIERFDSATGREWCDFAPLPDAALSTGRTAVGSRWSFTATSGRSDSELD